MSKDNVVIEEGGMRYEFEEDGICILGECSTCQDKRPLINSICCQSSRMSSLGCISAVEIQPEPKMYFAWNREEASGLVGKVVEWHSGSPDSQWRKCTLLDITDSGEPFELKRRFAHIIR